MAVGLVPPSGPRISRRGVGVAGSVSASAAVNLRASPVLLFGVHIIVAVDETADAVLGYGCNEASDDFFSSSNGCCFGCC